MVEWFGSLRGVQSEVNLEIVWCHSGQKLFGTVCSQNLDCLALILLGNKSKRSSGPLPPHGCPPAGAMAGKSFSEAFLPPLTWRTDLSAG